MNITDLATRFFPHLMTRHAIECVNAVLLSHAKNDASSILPPSKGWFQVRNQSDETKPVEILIYDQIGKDWFSDDGIAAKDFAEHLRTIPTAREITVRINSPGGNVADGLAIYNQLQSRKANVTCVVDGIAASIASVIAMAGRETVMCANSLMMIHEPTCIAMGNAEDMRKMAERLEANASVIVGVYASRTTKDPKEIRRMMTEETWMTGTDAKQHGFANRLTEEQAAISNKFDFSQFRNVPQALKTVTTAAANTGAASNPNQNQNPMNRQQIIAMLKKHGIQFEASATDEQLVALLNNIPIAAPAPANAATNPPPAPAVPPAVPVPAAADPNAALQAQVQALTTAAENDRRTRVTNAVNQFIAETRITAAQREWWIARAMADEAGTIAALNAIEPHPPGANPVPMAAITSEAIPDIVRHFETLEAPANSFIRNQGTVGERHRLDIRNAAISSALHYRQHRDRLLPVLNANTVPAGLQRNAILQEMMTAFEPVLLPLNAFSTRFENVPLEGTDKVEIAYYALQTAASTDFNGTYAAGNTVTAVKELTVDKRKYQGMAFTSSELRRQPYLNVLKLGQMNAMKLAADVFADVLSVVTLAKYGAAVLTELPSAFDTEDIADLAEVADLARWPKMGRSLILHSSYLTPLRKAKALTSVADSGSAQTLRDGVIGRISSFDVFDTPELPDNSENLKGFISFPSCIGVVTAPILPAPGVRQTLVAYQMVASPRTGLTFEYRHWGAPTTDTDTEVIECNYGYGELETAALKRITSA